MLKATGFAIATLMMLTTGALAQASSTDASQGKPPEVLGPTGTMYDGSNAHLQLPAEPNGYWANLWAEPTSAPTYGQVPTAGPAAASSSAGGTLSGGAH